MKPEKLEIKTALQIQKSVNEVFQAIINPEEMSVYFISKSDGWIEEGKTLNWEFPEFQGSWPVKILKVEKDKHIAFSWEVLSGHVTRVEIGLEKRENNSTLIRIVEKGMKNDEKGIKWMLSNTEGWSFFMACLKAYLEYGINLRKGGYDFITESDFRQNISDQGY
jgi:uncharacterized protein YndB with AHSA1/START domain